ncbi:hypothetical protein ACFE04_010831 [Oxalis oulophora]
MPRSCSDSLQEHLPTNQLAFGKYQTDEQAWVDTIKSVGEGKIVRIRTMDWLCQSQFAEHTVYWSTLSSAISEDDTGAYPKTDGSLLIMCCLDKSKVVRKVSCGAGHVLPLSEDAAVQAWGKFPGQIKLGSSSQESDHKTRKSAHLTLCQRNIPSSDGTRVDRVYLHSPNIIAVIDHEKKRTYVVRKEGLPDAAVEKAVSLKPGEEWTGRLDLMVVVSSLCCSQGFGWGPCPMCEGSIASTHKIWRVREEFARIVAYAVTLFASIKLPLQRSILPPVFSFHDYCILLSSAFSF